MAFTMVRAAHHGLTIVVLVASLLSQMVVVADETEGGFRCIPGQAQNVCLDHGYLKSELPEERSVNVVSVFIDIDEVLAINDKDNSITFACYFNIQWTDERIQTNPNFPNSDNLVPVNLELVNSLWMPNVFIYNLKTYKTQNVLNKVAGLWMSAKKVVLYSEAAQITFVCPMRFDKFPMDTQRCKFQVIILLLNCKGFEVKNDLTFYKEDGVILKR